MPKSPTKYVTISFKMFWDHKHWKTMEMYLYPPDVICLAYMWHLGTTVWVLMCHFSIPIHPPFRYFLDVMPQTFQPHICSVGYCSLMYELLWFWFCYSLICMLGFPQRIITLLRFPSIATMLINLPKSLYFLK